MAQLQLLGSLLALLLAEPRVAPLLLLLLQGQSVALLLDLLLLLQLQLQMGLPLPAMLLVGLPQQLRRVAAASLRGVLLFQLQENNHAG
jgi:hypothetical protein